MVKEQPMIVLGESGRGTECNRSSGMKIIGLEFNVLDEPVDLHIAVADRQATLADIVPLARKLATKLALVVLDKLKNEGKIVPCRKGCSACCSYLTPLSVPEVFCLRQEVLAMPADQGRTVLKSCLETAKKILENWPGKFETNELTKINGQSRHSDISRWYAGLELLCPLSSDGLCTAYQQRPIACREHLVTGSVLSCNAKKTDELQVVQTPVSILEALAQLTAELEQSTVEAVMLPLALPWAQENLERANQTWPAVMMVKRFIEFVKAMASANSTASLT